MRCAVGVTDESKQEVGLHRGSGGGTQRWRFALERRGEKIGCSKMEYLRVNERN